MKIYISSTYLDLIEHRAAVDLALRRMGHDVIGMERYVAERVKPLERCRDDVRRCDVLVLLVAWRYGYRPPGDDDDRERSITHIEYSTAVQAGKPVLAFLLDPQAPWPPARMDQFDRENGARPGARIEGFRSEIGTNLLAGSRPQRQVEPSGSDHGCLWSSPCHVRRPERRSCAERSCRASRLFPCGRCDRRFERDLPRDHRRSSRPVTQLIRKQ